MDDLTADKLYYVKKKNGDVCIRQAHLFSTLKTEKAMSFVDFDDDDILAVLAPVPTYDQFSQLVKKVEQLESKLSCISEQLDIVTEQRNDIHIDKQVLQEQLKEANKIIKKLYKESGNPTGCDYLEKWGVK